MKEIQIQNRSTHLRSTPYVDSFLAVAGDAQIVRPDDVMPGAAERWMTHNDTRTSDLAVE